MAISLANVVKAPRLKPPKVVLMGVGGIGKTTFAAHAPDPVFLMTEEGAGVLTLPAFEARAGDPLLRSWAEIMECVSALYTEPHEYKTVVLDSLDFAEPLLWEHTASKHGKEDIEAFGYGKGYVAACDEARVLLRGLDALRNERGMAIVLIAHTDVVRFEAPDAEAYDRFQPRLQKRLAALVHDWTDALLFANYKAHVRKDSTRPGQKDDQKRRRAVGTGERVMYTQERPAHWAKNRYNLPFELPLSWAAFQDAIAASATTQEP